MSGFASALAQITAAAPPKLLHGVVEAASGGLAVNVHGQQISALWADPVTVVPGDNVLVAVSGGVRGQFVATVLCKTTTTPRPPDGTVTAVPGGSPTITVSINDESFACRYLSDYAPTVGDLVALVWHGGAPMVVGKVSTGVAADPAPKTGVKSPVKKVTTGVEKFAASASGTWSHSSGGWSNYYGSDLTQGTWGSNSYSGAWFYGSGPQSKLQGKTITKVKLRYGARKRMGNYNSALTLNLYRHTHTSRGGSEPPRVAGPTSVNLPVNAPAGWVSLPTSWGQAIVDSGGGISISGGGYGGVAGRGADAASGLLEIHWSD